MDPDPDSDPDLDADQDPTVFVIDLKMPTKKCFFYLLLCEGTLTSFSKDKKSIKSHKTVGIKAFLTIFA